MVINPFPAKDVESAFSGRYVLGAELRVGGQGVVYRAQRVRDSMGTVCGDDIALKLHLDANQDIRVEREIEAMKHLNDSALATLLEEGVVEIAGKRTRYIAWKFIEGEPLDVKLSRGAMLERDVARMGRDVASAIKALWSKRIVHRDIAPKNVMLRPDGRAILIDLGGARHLDNTSITAVGSTFGTPGYFSPEQFRAERALTSASDVYALGIVMLECLIGHHPTNRDQNQLILNPPSPEDLVPSATAEMKANLRLMLHARAPFRPDPEELRQTLDKLAIKR